MHALVTHRSVCVCVRRVTCDLTPPQSMEGGELPNQMQRLLYGKRIRSEMIAKIQAESRTQGHIIIKVPLRLCACVCVVYTQRSYVTGESPYRSGDSVGARVGGRRGGARGPHRQKHNDRAYNCNRFRTNFVHAHDCKFSLLLDRRRNATHTPHTPPRTRARPRTDSQTATDARRSVCTISGT